MKSSAVANHFGGSWSLFNVSALMLNGIEVGEYCIVLFGQVGKSRRESKLGWNSDDVINRKHFPRYWPFVRGIQRSPVNFPHKGQWRGALMFSLICAWTNSWINDRDAGDLRRRRDHYEVSIMSMVNYQYLEFVLLITIPTPPLIIRRHFWIVFNYHTNSFISAVRNCFKDKNTYDVCLRIIHSIFV